VVGLCAKLVALPVTATIQRLDAASLKIAEISSVEVGNTVPEESSMCEAVWEGD
jgi:hypothetical protein